VAGASLIKFLQIRPCQRIAPVRIKCGNGSLECEDLAEKLGWEVISALRHVSENRRMVLLALDHLWSATNRTGRFRRCARTVTSEGAHTLCFCPAKLAKHWALWPVGWVTSRQ
jgi:hypothetical protein